MSAAKPAAVGGTWGPALILAADHRGRGVMTVERYADYLAALRAALPHADGILATAQPLDDLVRAGDVTTAQHRTYLSINRTGLAGAVFELDDRLVASVARAAADGCTGVKLMTRIDLTDAHTARRARAAGPGAGGRPRRRPRGPGRVGHLARRGHGDASRRHRVRRGDRPRPGRAAAQGAGARRGPGTPRRCPTTGGPRSSGWWPAWAPRCCSSAGPAAGDPDAVLAEATDVMAGGGAGLAIGRAVLVDPDPAGMARRMADVVHGV